MLQKFNQEFDALGRRKRQRVKHTDDEVARIWRAFPSEGKCITLAISKDGMVYRKETKLESGYSETELEYSLSWALDKKVNDIQAYIEEMHIYGWKLVSQEYLKKSIAKRRRSNNPKLSGSDFEQDIPKLLYERAARVEKNAARIEVVSKESRVLSKILDHARLETHRITRETEERLKALKLNDPFK